MTDMTCPRAAPRPGILASLARPIGAFVAARRREAEIRAAVRMLRTFDDKLLADIGIPRGEIAARVRGEDG